MPIISGTNVSDKQAGSIAELEARIKAAEESGIHTQNMVLEETTPTSQSPVQNTATLESPKVETLETKVAVPQQFKDKEGQLDEDKIQQSNEHLEKGILNKEERAAKLVKINKELREKHRQTSEVVKRLESEAADPLAGIDVENLTPEFRQKLTEDFEKDFVGTQLKLQKAFVQREMDRQVKPLHNQVSEIHERNKSLSMEKELDDLVEQGHTWIVEEGAERFNRLLAERPELKPLLNSPQPYHDLIRFIDDVPQKNGAAGQTQFGRSSPILGATRAVPPPSANPTVSPDSDMRELSRQFNIAMSQKNTRVADELLRKMEILERS